jgi:uncharacterized protein involved in type VI secretion and phage assembly
VATLDAGDGRGTYFRPEIGDEVIVGFLDSDPRHPVVLGMCHSSAKPSPELAQDDNHHKGYVSRSKIRLTFDDDKKVVVLETPAGNKITLSEEDQAISVVDQNGSSIKLEAAGITIESANALTLKAASQVTLQGSDVVIQSDANLALKGSANVEVSSSGTATLRGSLVRIN